MYEYTKQKVCLDMTKSKTNARGEYIYIMGVQNTSPLKKKKSFSIRFLSQMYYIISYL